MSGTEWDKGDDLPNGEDTEGYDFEIGKEIDDDYLDLPSETRNDDNPPLRTRIPRTHQGDIDTSPSSGATDPEHAAQDQGTDYVEGRHRYQLSQTSIGGDLKSKHADKSEKEMGELTRGPADEVNYSRNTLNSFNRKRINNAGNTSQRQKEVDRINDTENWGKWAGLSEYEIEEAKHILRKLSEDGDNHFLEGFGNETAILGAIAYVGFRETEPEGRKLFGVTATGDLAEEQEGVHDHQDSFTEIREGLNISPTSVKNARYEIESFLSDD